MERPFSARTTTSELLILGQKFERICLALPKLLSDSKHN